MGSNSQPLNDLDASLLKITLTSSPRPVPSADSPEIWNFSYASDHMVTVNWTSTHGWYAPELKPYGPLSIMPTASCLHYATQAFEGMKGFRGYDGKLRLFRPSVNCKRLLSSTARVALPGFPAGEVEKLIKALMKVDGPRESLSASSPLIILSVDKMLSQAGFPSPTPEQISTFVLP